MKFKGFLSSLVAVVALFAACDKQIVVGDLAEINVNNSYVSIPEKGGSAQILVNATEEWKVVDSSTEQWLKISASSGAAGETTITLSAEASLNSRSTVLKLSTKSGKTQYVNVKQQVGDPSVSVISTVKEVNEGPKGKVYTVEGIVTNIVQKEYGNWTLVDAEGNGLYIYGTLNSKGEEKKFSEVGISEGDKVTVTGPKDVYNGTIELVNVKVDKIIKSLVQLKTASPVELTKAGGKFSVELECSGNGVSVSIPDAYKSWIALEGINTDGKKIVVNFNAAENTAAARSATLSFTSTKGESSSTVSVVINQEGAIIRANAAELNAVADGPTVYRVTGRVSNIKNTEYGNFDIVDYSGSIYVYGCLDAEGKTKKFASLGINEGDIVTVIGPKSSYKGSAQMVNVSVEEHHKLQAVSVADFNAKPVGTDVFYQLTGTVGPLKDGDAYGNFDLTDSTGSVYVYGLRSFVNGDKKLFQDLIKTAGIKEGDTITIGAHRSAYKDQIQAGDAFFISKEEAAPVEPVITELTITLGDNAYDDGEAKINGAEEAVKVWKMGASKADGTLTITVPAGTKTLTFYSVAWKGKNGYLTLTPNDGTDGLGKTINPNDGASGNPPYTIAGVTEADLFTVNVKTTDKPVTYVVTGTGRYLLWDFKIEK